MNSKQMKYLHNELTRRFAEQLNIFDCFKNVGKEILYDDVLQASSESRFRYREDAIFRSKVESLVVTAMQAVNEYSGDCTHKLVGKTDE